MIRRENENWEKIKKEFNQLQEFILSNLILN